VDEVSLAALITGAFGLAVAVVNVLGKRLEREVTEHPDVLEADVLRSGIRRHIIRCPRPGDLLDLLTDVDDR
jgi:hypothetical protein